MEEDIKEIKCFFNKNFFVNGNWASIHRNEIANLEEAIENLLKRYKELEERDEARTYTVNKVIAEYIPDYELISLVNRYKNESFIPRVEVEKILEERSDNK